MKKTSLISVILLSLIQGAYGGGGLDLKSSGDEFLHPQVSYQLYNCDTPVEGVMSWYQVFRNGLSSIDPRKSYGPKDFGVINPECIPRFEEGHPLHSLAEFLYKEFQEFPFVTRSLVYHFPSKKGKPGYPVREDRRGWFGYTNEFLRFMEVFSQVQKTLDLEVVGVGSGRAFPEKAFSCLAPTKTKAYDAQNPELISTGTLFMPVAIFKGVDNAKNLKHVFPKNVSQKKSVLFSSYTRNFIVPYIERFAKNGGETIILMHEGVRTSAFNPKDNLDRTYDVNQKETRDFLNTWTQHKLILPGPKNTAMTVYSKNEVLNTALKDLWEREQWTPFYERVTKEYAEAEQGWGQNYVKFITDRNYRMNPDLPEGNLAFLNEVLTRGFNINERSEEGHTLLTEIVTQKDYMLTFLPWLIDHGLRLDSKFNGETAFHIASQSPIDYLETAQAIMELLLDKGMDINIKNDRGQTAFSLKLEDMQKFRDPFNSISSPTPEQFRDAQDRTLKDIGILKFLIEKGADVTLEDVAKAHQTTTSQSFLQLIGKAYDATLQRLKSSKR